MVNFIYFFLKPLIRFIWIRKVEGIENIPKQGAIIIASNHESYFDFLCFSAVCPRPLIYLAGEVFFKKWWWRIIMKLTGQIKVDRNSKDKSASLKSALLVLEEGKILGIFPEGTRSPNGELQKAFIGVTKIALTARVKVIPVGMIGTYNIMSKKDKFPKLKKCSIKIGKPLDLSQFYNERDDKNRLEFITNKIIMSKIAELVKKDYKF
jgi:1-acyl-sn-glycerol-3-phosphate acyltransferase